MNSKTIKKLKLPDSSGVYTFTDPKGRPLYIGRATSLRDRVKSYFSNDLIQTRGPRIVDMIVRARKVKWHGTDSVLEAIILESTLIKRYQPYYNIAERDDKSSQYVVITDESWPRVFLARARDFDLQVKEGNLPYKIKGIFGPYLEGGLIKEALKILRKLFPFKDKKAHDPRHEAFYRAIGQSPDDNDGAHLLYKKTIKYLILFFNGKKREIRRQINKDMNNFAKELKFEEAGKLKRLLYAMDHINDIALIKRSNAVVFGSFVTPAKAVVHDRIGNMLNKNVDADFHRHDNKFRMEAYDISHLSGTNVVGAMTVSVDGEFLPSQYRKFKISKQANNDIAGLKEILNRRLNHSEWIYPNLIIVDGNETHMRQAEDVLKARRITIPVLAVTKDEHHKATRLIGHPQLISKYQKEIVALNTEAHRFAIKYHRSKRRVGL